MSWSPEAEVAMPFTLVLQLRNVYRIRPLDVGGKVLEEEEEAVNASHVVHVRLGPLT